MKHISVKDLTVKHDGASVLKGLNFEAFKGEFVVIVGKSGSGKTNFLKSLAGFITFTGEVVMPEKVGMVFQHYAVFPWLTVAENIAFGLDNKSDEEKNEIIKENLKLAELEDKKDKYPAELSGGQVQRVALARSLAHDPEVLLMDEPYGALDAYTRDKMQQWLLKVWSERKKTIIFVTHNIEEAIFLADRVIIMKNKKFAKEVIVSFKRPRNEDIKFSFDFNKLRKVLFDSLE